MGQSISERSSPIQDVFAHEVVRSGFDRVLRTIRRYLGMDVAFISHFRIHDRVFEHVDADGPAPIAPQQALSLEEGYCLKVVRGELPECIPDTAEVPAAMCIPATTAIPIGSHLSVPIRLENGEIYGTLCCFSYMSDRSLGPREMKMMHAFAEVLAGRIDEAAAAEKLKQRESARLRLAMAAGTPRMVYQPIHEVADRSVAGVECLARFDIEPKRGPDKWFEAAGQVGMGEELELRAILNALPALERLALPAFLGLNTSPELVLSGRLGPVLEGLDLSRVVLEITEHATVVDYGALAQALGPMREKGLRLAVDDAGAGFASMRHILNLQPNIIKLDMSLTRDIDTDGARRALAKGLISFAHEIGSSITAEGVETESEFEMLRRLGVYRAQGYFLSRPMPIEEVPRAVANA